MKVAVLTLLGLCLAAIFILAVIRAYKTLDRHTKQGVHQYFWRYIAPTILVLLAGVFYMCFQYYSSAVQIL